MILLTFTRHHTDVPADQRIRAGTPASEALGVTSQNCVSSRQRIFLYLTDTDANFNFAQILLRLTSSTVPTSTLIANLEYGPVRYRPPT